MNEISEVGMEEIWTRQGDHFAVKRFDDRDDIGILYQPEGSQMVKRFAEKPVQIPDSDEIMADLIEPAFSYDSKGRYLIEAKAEIKKRGGRSPDIADGLSLTFAEPVRMKKDIRIEAAPFEVLDNYTGY